MKKYSMSWTTKDGQRIRNQIYTADMIGGRLMDLEKCGAMDIDVTSIEEDVKRDLGQGTYCKVFEDANGDDWVMIGGRLRRVL